MGNIAQGLIPRDQNPPPPPSLQLLMSAAAALLKTRLQIAVGLKTRLQIATQDICTRADSTAQIAGVVGREMRNCSCVYLIIADQSCGRQQTGQEMTFKRCALRDTGGYGGGEVGWGWGGTGGRTMAACHENFAGPAAYGGHLVRQGS